MSENNFKTTLRKKLRGIVVSDKNKKTRVVEVTRTIRHPLYSKVMKKKKKFYAHDEKEISQLGNSVIIEEMRPMSALKRWRIVKVLIKK